MNRFTDKVVLVTGGSTGIGQATARAFAAEGAIVVVAGRRATEGEQTVAMLRAQGAEARFIRTDVSVEADVAHLLKEITTDYGRLDIAFNNAGSESAQRYVAELSEDDWDATIAVNLKGTWLCMKYEIQRMLSQGNGVIVNMAANIAHIGLPNMGDYIAAKAGVLGLTKVAALETIGSGIRINAVSPGATGTPMAERLFGSLENQLQLLGPLHPIGRVATPDEVAAAVLWLSSSEATFVVGQDIVIDGGMIIQ